MNSLMQTLSSYPAAHSQSSANYGMEYGLVMWIARSVYYIINITMTMTISGIVTMLERSFPSVIFEWTGVAVYTSLHNMLPFCE